MAHPLRALKNPRCGWTIRRRITAGAGLEPKVGVVTDRPATTLAPLAPDRKQFLLCCRALKAKPADFFRQ